MSWAAAWRWGPPLVWMALISLGSTELFAASETSRFIGPFLRWLLPEASPETLGLLHAAIRKLGHVGEFGLLALLWYRALAWGAAGWRGRQALQALAWTVGCAALDEFHQSLEPSRTGSILDVAWDGLGAALALLLRRRLAPPGPERAPRGPAPQGDAGPGEPPWRSGGVKRAG